MASSSESYLVNVRSPRYQLALTVSPCLQCGSPTAVVGVVVPPGHETLDPEDDPRDGAPQSGDSAPATWSVAHHNAFLFHLEFLPDVVRAGIQRLLPAYRPADGSMNGTGWANHCENCGELLDDHELFCEPDGAFLPTSQSRAAAIHLVNIDQPFEAAAAGYAHEPQYFDAMTCS